jgi:hypothetical protein
MNQAETNLVRRIMLALGRISHVRLFRNNVGTGWVGKSTTMPGRGILISDPRRLDAGLIEGSSDLIGWTSVEITPEMVGKTVAIFTGIEVKTMVGTMSGKQLNFMNQLRTAGGIVGVVRSPEEALKLLNIERKN